MSHWAAQYLGRPWRSGGQGPAEFDCWGLVRYVMQRHYGRTLPAIQVDALDLRVVRNTFATTPVKAMFEQVMLPEDGDAVLMYKGSTADHVGLWLAVDGGRILHAAQGIGVAISPPIALRRLGWHPLQYWRYTR